MTLTLDLTPEEHEALRRRAETEGTDIRAVLRGLIAALAPPVSPGDTQEDAEERAERDREREEIQANLARWRTEQG